MGSVVLTAFNRVQLLLPCPKMKSLRQFSEVPQRMIRKLVECAVKMPWSCWSCRSYAGPHTSVSIAKSGFHESGGMILQIP